MPDYSLPIYDYPRKWINSSRERGISWDSIIYARKKDDAGLKSFLENQEDLNFWPWLNG